MITVVNLCSLHPGEGGGVRIERLKFKDVAELEANVEVNQFAEFISRGDFEPESLDEGVQDCLDYQQGDVEPEDQDAADQFRLQVLTQTPQVLISWAVEYDTELAAVYFDAHDKVALLTSKFEGFRKLGA